MFELLYDLEPMTSSTIDESEFQPLVARLKAGDSSALQELMEILNWRISAKIRSEFPQLSAEDIVQDTWLKVWEKRTILDYQGMAAFRSWILTIATNNAISQTRKKRAGQLPEEVDVAAQEFDEEHPWIQPLRDCVAQFLKSDNKFVQMVVEQCKGASTVELAGIFDLATGTVGSRLTRGRQLLKECVESKCRES